MTGYGKASGKLGDRAYTVEVRSLNAKQLNLKVQVPARFREKEIELRSSIAERIPRGRVDVTVTEDEGEAEQLYRVNGEVLRAHYRELERYAKELGDGNSPLLATAMQIPDSLSYSEPAPEQEELEGLQELLKKALEEFDRFTEKEGANTKADLEKCLKGIREGLEKVEGQEDERRKAVEERLRKRVQEALDPGSIDENRFEQELLYYLERLDINEEKARLKSHLEQFEAVVENEGSGKKLHFVAQEIGREINTIGSKADHAPMQQEVVGMKDELERIKEQVMNLL